MNRTAIGVSPAIPFSGKGGSAVPNKDECLQSVVNKKPAYNADSGYWEYEDAIGKVKKTPLEGNVFNFEGDDDYIDLDAGVNSVASLTKGKIVCSFLTTSTGAYEMLFSCSDKTDASDDVSIYKNSANKLVIVLRSNYNFFAWISNDVITDGKKHTLSFEVNDTGNVIKLDGEEAPGTYSVGDENSTFFFADVPDLNTMRIGIREDSGGNEYPWKGIISNVKIYNGDKKLIHAWHCDETAGDLAYDSVKEWYGNNRLINGDFSTGNLEGWDDTTIVSYENGYAKIDFNIDNPVSILSQDVLDEGEKYIVSFKYKTSTDSTIIRPYDGEVYHTPIIIADDIWRTTFVEFTAKGSLFKFRKISSPVSGNMLFLIDEIKLMKVHEPSHGTLEGIYAPTFFTTDNRFKSYQNELGYSEDVTDGVEILENGDFSSATGWTPVRSSLDVSTGKGVVTNTDPTLNGYIRKSFTTEVGKRYRIRATYFGTLSTVTGNTNIRVGNFGADDSLGRQDVANLELDEPLSFIFTATATETFVSLYSDNGGGEVHIWDNISIQEVPEGLIPIAIDKDEESTKLDIFGNTPTYLGLTKNNLKVVGNSCLSFDGTDDYVDLGETITIYDGYIETRVKSSTTFVNKMIIGKNGMNFIAFNNGTEFRVRINGEVFDFVVPTYTLDTEFIKIKTVLTEGDSNIGVRCFFNDIESTTTIQYTSDKTGLEVRYLGFAEFTGSSFNGLMDYAIISNGNKTYTYNLGEGAGDFAYDSTPAAYGDDVVSGWSFEDSWTEASAEVNNSSQFTPINNNGTIYKNIAGLESDEKYAIHIRGSATGASSVSIRGGNAGPWDIGTIVLGNSFDVTIYPTIGASLFVAFIGSLNGEQVTIDAFEVKKVLNPINGTLTGDPTWTTDDKATPSNLLEGFNKGILCTNGGAKTFNSIGEGLQEYETTFYLNEDIDSTSDKQVLASFIDYESTNYFRVIFGVSTGLLDDEIITVMDKNSGVNYRSGYCSTTDVIKKGWHTIKIVHTGGSTNYAIYLDGTRVDNEYSGTDCPIHDVSYVTFGDSSNADTPFNGSITNAKLTTTSDTYEWDFATANDGEVPCDNSDYNAYNQGYEIINLPVSMTETLNNPAYKDGAGHNNAESKLEEYKVPSLYQADLIEGGNNNTPLKYLYGEELSPDVYFDSAMGWNIVGNAAVTGGQAVITNGALYDGIRRDYISSNPIPIGSEALVIIDVDEITAGSLQFYINGSGLAPQMQSITAGLNIIKIDVSVYSSDDFMIRAGTANTYAKINSFSIKNINNQTPAQIEYRDIDYDQYELDPYHIAFNNAEELKKRNMLVYDRTQSGDDLTKIYKFTKDKVLRDQNGTPLTDGDGNIIYHN